MRSIRAQGRVRWLLPFLAMLALGVSGSAFGQTSPAGAPQDSPKGSDAPSFSQSAPPPDAQQTSPVPGDSAAPAALAVDLPAKPVARLDGQASWDDGFSAIQKSIAQIQATLAQAKINPAGRPFAVFVETDDKGFQYQAMIPIRDPGTTTPTLGGAVRLGKSPSGKALKFEHRGPYDDIAATYEAITAYLDEKGIEAKDMFIEEYLNDASQPDDANIAVDIYVFI